MSTLVQRTTKYTDEKGNPATMAELVEVPDVSAAHSRVSPLYTRNNNMNVLRLANAMCKAEIDLICNMTEQPGYADFDKYIYDYPTTNFTKSQRVIFYRALSKLRKKGLIKRVGKAQYMFNPEFFIPTMKVIDAATDLWNTTP